MMGRTTRPLLILLAIGLVLRLATLIVPSIHHPDEIYQYLEAAHRLVFGYGVVPWEYRAGIRSWLFPGLLAGPMALGSAIAPGSGLYLMLPRLAMVLASTTIIASAWALGARASPRHAFYAAFAAAIWFELIGFAAHPIGEAAALAAACGAAALMLGRHASRRQLVTAGALLALAGLLRFQYGPALLVLAGFGLGRDARARWMPIMAGGAAMLLLSAMVDLANGGLPFSWLAENIRQNIVLGRAASYGVSGPFTYLGVLGGMWGWASVPLLIAAHAGAKRQPALFWAAVVHLVLHSLIGHKEYRFILLTSGFAVILAGIGTADLIGWAQARVTAGQRRLVAPTLMLAWVAASALLAAAPGRAWFWTARSAALAAFGDLRAAPDLCGVAVLGLPMSEFGGYSALHRNVPLYLFDLTYPDERAQARRLRGAYNAIVASPLHRSEVGADFRLDRCRSTAGEYSGSFANPADARAITAVCVYRRPGPCAAAAQAAAAPLDINRAIADRGM